jgi:hypothetical protein
MWKPQVRKFELLEFTSPVSDVLAIVYIEIDNVSSGGDENHR